MTGGDRYENIEAYGPHSLTAVVNRTVTLLVVFLGIGLAVLDYSMFWVVFLVGFAGVLPAARSLARWYDTNHGGSPKTEPESPDDDRALENLRNRYARGEIDEAEFEEQVERLLETESTTGARTRGSDASTERSYR